MRTIFLTGASGYIGGTVAARLLDGGYSVRGLVRSREAAEALSQRGVVPVIGTLDDTALLAQEAVGADGVVNSASADHAAAVHAFITALQGTGKPLLHTSGSSVIGDDARGLGVSESIFDEDTPLVVEPLKQPRRDIDLAVLRAAQRGVRSAVICPSLIYGVGRGVNTRSVQIPLLVDNALAQGAVQVVGQGLNRWSNVHVDDVAQLYQLVLEKAPAGALYFAENGEASFAEIAEAIAARLGLGPVQHLAADLAAQRWGESTAFYTLGSNSRVRAKRARDELGWSPRHGSAVDWIRSEMPVSTPSQK
jgi:nucleoside-diphosphate-sugar epimerase